MANTVSLPFAFVESIKFSRIGPPIADQAAFDNKSNTANGCMGGYTRRRVGGWDGMDVMDTIDAMDSMDGQRQAMW
jgi:hypothetical protein